MGGGSGLWKGRGSSAADDVALEVVDVELLVGDDVLDDVTDADEADELVVFHDREVALTLFGHDGHAFVDRGVRRDGSEAAAHGFAHGSVAGGLAMEDDAAGVFALGEDAFEATLIENEDGPDVVFGHDLEGLVGGAFGSD